MNQNTSTPISTKPMIVPRPYEITSMIPVISVPLSGKIQFLVYGEYSAKMDELTSAVESNVTAALAEDIGSGDWTAQLIAATAAGCAHVITRNDAVICGA